MKPIEIKKNNAREDKKRTPKHSTNPKPKSHIQEGKMSPFHSKPSQHQSEHLHLQDPCAVPRVKTAASPCLSCSAHLLGTRNPDNKYKKPIFFLYSISLYTTTHGMDRPNLEASLVWLVNAKTPQHRTNSPKLRTLDIFNYIHTHPNNHSTNPQTQDKELTLAPKVRLYFLLTTTTP